MVKITDLALDVERFRHEIEAKGYATTDREGQTVFPCYDQNGGLCDKLEISFFVKRTGK